MDDLLSGIDEDLVEAIDRFIADRDAPPVGTLSRLDALNVIATGLPHNNTCRFHPPRKTHIHV